MCGLLAEFGWCVLSQNHREFYVFHFLTQILVVHIPFVDIIKHLSLAQFSVNHFLRTAMLAQHAFWVKFLLVIFSPLFTDCLLSSFFIFFLSFFFSFSFPLFFFHRSVLFPYLHKVFSLFYFSFVLIPFLFHFSLSLNLRTLSSFLIFRPSYVVILLLFIFFSSSFLFLFFLHLPPPISIFYHIVISFH